MDGIVRYESRDRVAWITLDRPEKRNAMSLTMSIQLREAWDRFNSGDDVVAVLAGEGDQAFTGGADLTDMSPELVRANFAAMPGVGVVVEKPIITAVSGWCVGMGVSLVAYSDLTVATEDSRFLYPEPKLGFSAGLLASLAMRIPTKAAMEILLLAEPVEARRAYEMGFVNRLTASGEHLSKAGEMAANIAASAPLALRLIKRFCEDTIPRGRTVMARQTDFEIEAVLYSADRAEGIAAFHAGRAPQFVGE
jgi:enoyl-CoA hydratase/carnithine racemase